MQLFILLKSLYLSLHDSVYIRKNRFDSFSPIREHNFAKFFVNGEGYFSSLYDDLLTAKFEVYIRGWWICPELYLKRPSQNYPQSRLDKVIELIANK